MSPGISLSSPGQGGPLRPAAALLPRPPPLGVGASAARRRLRPGVRVGRPGGRRGRAPAGEDWSAGAVMCATDDMSEAISLCRHLRRREEPVSPLLLIVARHEVSELKLRNDLFDDFCVAPLHPGELAARRRARVLADRPAERAGRDRARAARPQPRDLPGRHRRADPRPHLHGVPAAPVLGHPPRQGVHPRDAAQPGVGLRVLRRRPHGRRPRAAAPRQARRGACPPHPDRALGRLPAGPGGLDAGPAWRAIEDGPRRVEDMGDRSAVEL